MLVIIRHKYANPQSNAAYLRQIGGVYKSNKSYMVIIKRHKYATAHSKAAYLRQIGVGNF